MASAPSPISIDDCSLTDPGSEKVALAFRIGGIFGILISSTLGFCLPFILRGRHNTILFFSRTFAAGVVLATAIVHIIPDAQDVLTNPCLGLSDRMPWPSIIILFSCLLCFTVEVYIRRTMMRLWRLKHSSASSGTTLSLSHSHSSQVELCVSGQDTCVDCGTSSEPMDAKELMQQTARAAAYTLEAGIIFHSLFVGISLGTSREATYVQGLAIALIFHQGFEGLSLGTTLVRAGLKLPYLALLCALFALTTPVGIAIGLAVGSVYNANSPAALGVEGAFTAMSAGILLYNGLVDLIVPSFDEACEDTPTDDVVFGMGFVFLFLGAVAMSALAYWA